MARAAAIPGRPTPARRRDKPSPKDSLLESRGTSSKQQTQVSKAAKRAAKRAELLSKIAPTNSAGPRGNVAGSSRGYRPDVGFGQGDTVSKSALRRRKRRARDDVGRDDEMGRRGGVQELGEALQDVEEAMMDDEEEDEDGNEEVEGAGAEAYAQEGGGRHGKMSAKKRRNVLTQEEARQKAIFSDKAFTASPFAALRTHIKNTLR